MDDKVSGAPGGARRDVEVLEAAGTPVVEPTIATLFRLGSYRLASGRRSSWKVECDALGPSDWETLALVADDRLRLRFRLAVCVPSGGAPLARAMRQYERRDGPVLICDDVLTTGESMQRELDRFGPDSIGLVAFARGPVPERVSAIWTLA